MTEYLPQTTGPLPDWVVKGLDRLDEIGEQARAYYDAYIKAGGSTEPGAPPALGGNLADWSCEQLRKVDPGSVLYRTACEDYEARRQQQLASRQALADVRVRPGTRADARAWWGLVSEEIRRVVALTSSCPPRPRRPIYYLPHGRVCRCGCDCQGDC